MQATFSGYEMLLPMILSLVVSAVLYGIAYDVSVFMYRTEKAYDYAKEIVPEYLEDEKEFIFEKFLPELLGWKEQHEWFAKVASNMFVIILVVALGTSFLASGGAGAGPGFLLLAEAVGAATIGVYFAFFRPRKAMLYTMMDKFDTKIKDIKDAAN